MKYYIGIDLGGTNIACGVVSSEGKLIKTLSVPTRASRGPDELANDMIQTSIQVVKEAGLSMDEIEGVGVGVPGAIKDADGMVIYCSNLNMAQYPLAKKLASAFDKPVHLGNDADCAALGEVLAGASVGFDSAAMITIGTGIGGGLIRGKKVFTGWSAAGTEVGHMMLIMGGEQCGCGNKGCFEAYASATALIRQTKRAMEEHTDSKLWEFAGSIDQVNAKVPFDAAQAGDEVALALLDQYEEYLAAGIASLVNVLRPEVIVLGGGVSKQGDYLLLPLKEKMEKYCYGSAYIAPPEMVCATLGNDAGIIGAALLSR